MSKPRILVIFAAVLASCFGTVPEGTRPGPSSPTALEGAFGGNIQPRCGLSATVESKPFVGTAVVPRQSSLLFRFNLPKNTIRFNIRTCHRDEWFIRPDTSKPLEWRWVPEMYLENVGSCILSAAAITDKGEYFCSLVDFVTGEELLMRLGCNGVKSASPGVGFCQAYSGTIQRVCFDEATVVATKEKCVAPVSDGGWCYTIPATPGLCAYEFMNKAKQKARLTVYGYTEVREAKVEGDRW